MKGLHVLAFTLLVVGGLNWLLQGLFMWDISQLFGGMDMWASRIIYILVGLAAVYELLSHKKNCMVCGNRPMMQ